MSLRLNKKDIRDLLEEAAYYRWGVVPRPDAVPEVEDEGWNESDDNSDEDQSEAGEEEEKDTDEVAPSSEAGDGELHGGSHASREVESSPNAAESGRKSKDVREDSGNGDGTEEVRDANEATYSSDTGDSQKSSGNAAGDGHDSEDVREDGGKGQQEERINLLDHLSRIRERVSCDPIVTTVEEIMASMSGSHVVGVGARYDSRKIAKDLVTFRRYRIPEDRADRGDAKKALVFVDLSGSFERVMEPVCEAIDRLARKYQVTVMACPNGFIRGKDECFGDEADVYHNGDRLKKIVSKTKARCHKSIVTPCVKTAVGLVNEAEVSIILADYDGFASFSELSNQVMRDKVPHFLDFDNRYEYPCDHDWVGDEGDNYADRSRMHDLKAYFGPLLYLEDDDYWDESEYDSEEDQ